MTPQERFAAFLRDVGASPDGTAWRGIVEMIERAMKGEA